jgi:hypothetical protein
MSVAPPSGYNTNLSKAQGLIPETLELLELWQPGMSPLELRNLVKETGALDRASDTRVTDVVSRGFAQRYLIEDGQPASWLKLLAQQGLSRPALRQLMFLYTARHNAVLHDFLTQVYWRKATSAAGEVTKDDTRDFLERAVLTGQIQPRWSDSMMERVTRYLLGTLEDFQMIAGNRHGRRQTTSPVIMEQTVLFLAYDLHFRSVGDGEIHAHPDWALFGLSPAQVLTLIDRAATKGHLHLQNAGQVIRIEWKYSDMNQVIHAITH